MTAPNQNHPLRRVLYGAFIFAFFLLLFSCEREPLELVFSNGPDDSGAIKELVHEFNRQHLGKIHVTFQEGARSSNDYYRELEREFKAESPSIHLLAADVVWTPAFAHNGWVENISDRFFAEYRADDFVKAALGSASYNNDVWGVPWYTDTGILFYRKDLLQQSGFNQPPTTWEELQTMAAAVQEEYFTKYGYVFQGANYEGGVTNACEFVWNAGGHILLSDLSISDDPAQDYILAVNSEETLRGLKDAQSLIASGVSPAEVTGFDEQKCSAAFDNGDAVFMRSWPAAYSGIAQGRATVKPENVGVAPLPVSRAGDDSYSCLGGWNLMINARATEEEKKAAWKFIRFMTDQQQQHRLARNGGNLPSLRSLYEDEQLLKEVPAIGLAKEVMRNSRQRPVTPYYMDLSPEIAWAFSETLKGALTPLEAMETIEGLFQDVLLASN